MVSSLFNANLPYDYTMLVIDGDKFKISYNSIHDN